MNGTAAAGLPELYSEKAFFIHWKNLVESALMAEMSTERGHFDSPIAPVEGPAQPL